MTFCSLFAGHFLVCVPGQLSAKPNGPAEAVQQGRPQLCQAHLLCKKSSLQGYFLEGLLVAFVLTLNLIYFQICFVKILHGQRKE